MVVDDVVVRGSRHALRSVVVMLGVASLGASSCTRASPEKTVASDAVYDERLRALQKAEWTRDVASVGLDDVSSKDARLRRAAVRALARVATETSRVALERALGDDDTEVVAWAAFGLGRICRASDPGPTIRRIVARAGTLALGHADGASAAALDPWFALAQALGRCGTKEAERALRSWIVAAPELARPAVQGLDYLVQSARDLDASTVVALLEAVERDRRLVVALLAISRLDRLDSIVGRRLLTMAPRILDTAGEERRFLLRAMPLVGRDALGLLERVVVDDGHYQPFERVEAIRALGKLDAPGQAALARILPRLWNFDGTPSEAELLSPKWSIWVELFEQLKEVPKIVTPTLLKLANVEAAVGRKSAEYRRISALRCRAAVLLSAGDPNSGIVADCDVTDAKRERKLAQTAILDRMRIGGKHSGTLELLLADRDPVVAMAALDVLGTHDELAMRSDLLVAALGAPSMGLVTTAARALVAHPPKSTRGNQQNADLAQVLERALSKDWPPDAVEVRTALMDAAAELGYLNVKDGVAAACVSPVPALREHAERALQRLGEPKRRCDAPRALGVPPEATHLVERPVVLRFHTEDVGTLELRLDPATAPLAVTRMVDLAKAGFYDGLAVHRVVPGFVVQLGDRAGDGFGGAGKPTLPCELAPRPFGPLDVGMALSGADSGSSQFFVTLGPYPQLGGDYSNVGRAGVGWDQLYLGDRVTKVEVVP